MYQNLLISIVSGTVIAIVSSYLTSIWTMKKFYTEKWWDRKEQAYTEIIKRKSRITSLLKSNNDNLEQSINDLDSFLNSKTIYQNQQISPRFTYIYEQILIFVFI